MMKNNVTRRAALGGIIGAAAVPQAVSRLAASQDRPAAAGEAPAKEGGYVEEALEAHCTQADAAGTTPAKPVLQNRARLAYNNPTSVQLYVPESLVLAGFWWMRNYRKGRGIVVPSGVNGRTIISFRADLAFEDRVHYNSWYSIFACARTDDSQVVYKLVPYFTVASRFGSTVILGDPGIGADASMATTYSGLADNRLAGVEVMVIEEREMFVGRTTTVTGNTNGTIALDQPGALARGDRLLVAPPGYEEYAWLCDTYIDTAEPRNIADTGTRVGMLQSNNIRSVPAKGKVELPIKIDCRSYVSPLALGIDLFRTFSVSTSSTGTVSDRFWHDSSGHEIDIRMENKLSTKTQSFSYGGISVPFSRQQAFWYSTSGTLDGNIVQRSMQPRGYYL